MCGFNATFSIAGYPAITSVLHGATSFPLFIDCVAGKRWEVTVNCKRRGIFSLSLMGYTLSNLTLHRPRRLS
jgi:hypothetical protein